MKLKCSLLGLLLSALLCAPSFAQEAEHILSAQAEDTCTELTRAMAAKINLNEAEFIVLKALNREMILKAEKITDTYRNDPATHEKKMREIITLFTNRLVPTLKPYQLQAFSKMELNANTWTVTAAK